MAGLEQVTDEEARKKFRQSAINHSILKRVVLDYLSIDTEFAKSHEREFIVVSHESANVYRTEGGAMEKQTSDDLLVQMGGGGLGEGYALVRGCEVRWFKDANKAGDYIRNQRENGISWYFTTLPESNA